MIRRGSGFVVLYDGVAGGLRARILDSQGVASGASVFLTSGLFGVMGINDDENLLVLSHARAELFDTSGTQIGTTQTGVGGRHNSVARNDTSGFAVARQRQGVHHCMVPPSLTARSPRTA